MNRDPPRARASSIADEPSPSGRESALDRGRSGWSFLELDSEQSLTVANELMISRMQQFQYLLENDLPILNDDLGLDDESSSGSPSAAGSNS